jgi:nitrite reductase (NADH) small subunit
MSQVAITHTQWQPICKRSDLVAHSGVCALVGDTSSAKSSKAIALFFIPDGSPQLYAIDNWDPQANAGVISRGLIADVDGELTVASPLYKHHYRLKDGVCIEDESVKLESYQVALDGDTVCIAISED